MKFTINMMGEENDENKSVEKEESGVNLRHSIFAWNNGKGKHSVNGGLGPQIFAVTRGF